MRHIQFLLDYTKKQKYSWWQYVLTVLGVILIRIFLENFSSPHQNGFFTSGYTTLLHYPFFYISIFLSLNLLIYYFSRLSIRQVFHLTILFFPIIWLPPLFDLLITSGIGLKMAYIFQPLPDLIKSFLSFFGPLYEPGITIGIRLEAAFILTGMFLLVLQSTRNIFRSILSVLVGYTVIFVYLSLPSLPAIISVLPDNWQAIIFFFKNSFDGSYLATIHTLEVLPTEASLLFEQQFNILMSRFWWLFILIQSVWLSFLAWPKIFSAWRKNLRWLRVFHYWLVGTIGILMAHKLTAPPDPTNWVDILSIIIFFILIAINFWLAVGINDLADLKIDSFSNKNRPLVQGKITLTQQTIINLILLGFLLSGILLFNYLVFILLILFQLIYYLYSVPPLRLKKYFLVSSLLVAFNAVIMVMAGFYLVSLDQHLISFPMKIFWLLLLVYFLVVNVKDIKDVEGDTQDGIKTIPIIFGETNGKKIIGLLCAAAVLIVPIVFQQKTLTFIALPFALLLYWLIDRKDYKESFVFYSYFLYALIVFLFIQIKS